MKDSKKRLQHRIRFKWADKFREMMLKIHESRAYKPSEKARIFDAMQEYVEYIDNEEERITRALQEDRA